MPKSQKTIDDIRSSGKSNILTLLLNAYYRMDQSLQDSISLEGSQQLTHSQSMIFLNMGEGRDRTVDIAAHIGISKQAINRTVNELVELGLISLIQDKQDKRVKRLRLTEAGALVAQEASSALEHIEKNIEMLLGQSEAHQLKAQLEKLASKA